MIDEYSFNRADYIIFPCEEAEEPYYHTWNKYDEIKKNNIKKFRYIPTGIQDINVRYDNKFIRNKFNIPENAFLISYVGRHNEIKGYDKLKIIGREIINEYDNVYFLIAGKESPIKGLENNRWIEVGWSDLPNEIINSSDLFILPNKDMVAKGKDSEFFCKNPSETDESKKRYDTKTRFWVEYID